MQRSMFQVLFYVRRLSEKYGQPFAPHSGMPRLTKAAGKSLEAQHINEKLENIKTNISVNGINASAIGIRMSRPKRSATPASVWAMTAACCRFSTNTLRTSSNVSIKIVLIPPTRITVCVAGVLPLSSNMNTMSRTFLSKSRKVTLSTSSSFTSPR